MGPAVMEEEGEGGGGGQQAWASCLVAKQAVEFPQVLASAFNFIDVTAWKSCNKYTSFDYTFKFG